MQNEPISMIDLVIETHLGLERQGPGSADMTLKALSFVDMPQITRAADLGCGTGGQTMVLARNITGHITGVDLFPGFIQVFNDHAQALNLQGRVQGQAGSMDDLSFPKEALDLIWSEGAIDNIGFEKGLRYWHAFLKPGGYVAVSCPSWLSDERPAEVEKFWADAGSGLDSIAHNISAMQSAGYTPAASFVLPETCWTDNYFAPRELALQALLKKYEGNQTVEAFVKENRYEVALYEKYKQYFGYVFYIGKKWMKR